VAGLAIRKRRVQELERRCHAGLSVSELRVEVLRRLRTIMTVDAAFFASVDPATLLFTGATQEEPLAGAAPLFLDNEFGQSDVNKFASLSMAPDPIRSLDDATQAQRQTSARYREIMAPLGLGDELRVALRVDSTTLGVMCLHREDGPAGFGTEDARVLAHIAPHIAEGLRRATLLEATGRGEPGETGVVVLEPDLSLAAVTPAAERLLSAMADEWPRSGQLPLPLPVYAVARQLLALDQETPPRVRLRDPDGRWLTLHAAHLRGSSGGIVVVLEPARAADVVPVILRARGLTSREAENAQLVVRGYSTRQIVDDLHISRHTVQDHLKAVFDKTGVRSRRELVAQLLNRPVG
jgi:DNA-binding CsgD family transcriptional regulator